MYDAIVIGAGIGGLTAAAKLARAGRRVLVLERKALPGGTSYFFRRGGYGLPMGPLGFSHPGRVRELLAEAGVDEPLDLRRASFEVRAPGIGAVISRPLAELERELVRQRPAEREGLARFFGTLREAIAAAKAAGPERWGAAVAELARTPSAAVLEGIIADVPLRNLLGSMGSGPPWMSMLNLALMWDVMSGEGIWTPARGVHVLADLLRDRFLAAGGELRLGAGVARVLVRGGRAAGVVTAAGETVEAGAVVSNADYKTTFLELVDPAALAGIGGIDLEALRVTPYTGSELCVYLGLKPEAVDLAALGADHLFYRRTSGDGGEADPGDFGRREIEICLWSRKVPSLVPPGRAALVLRAAFPYADFAPWRTGDKKRGDGYAAAKAKLAAALVREAETVVPGLSGAIEVMEAATPLTYRDWGGRYEGSVAGWAWEAGGTAAFADRVLVRTPVPGLLVAGAYASTELFLGGVPTALYTGGLAADLVI